MCRSELIVWPWKLWNDLIVSIWLVWLGFTETQDKKKRDILMLHTWDFATLHRVPKGISGTSCCSQHLQRVPRVWKTSYPYLLNTCAQWLLTLHWCLDFWEHLMLLGMRNKGSEQGLSQIRKKFNTWEMRHLKSSWCTQGSASQILTRKNLIGSLTLKCAPLYWEFCYYCG